MTILRVGSRTSALAVAQATAIANRIVEANDELSGHELVGVTTTGDTNYAPLTEIGGTGLFTKGVRQALADGECDIIVHSAKDLPAKDDPDFDLVFPERANPFDALCGAEHVLALREGAKVGTGSPRREFQLKLARPDLEIVPIRGNVPTRLGRIETDLDAVVLARAGLDRLGITTGVDIPFEIMLPAPAQGILGLEARAGSTASTWLAAVADHDATLAGRAERTFMTTLGAGCTEPLAAYASVVGNLVSLNVRWTNGQEKIELGRSGTDPIKLGTDLAHALQERMA